VAEELVVWRGRDGANDFEERQGPHVLDRVDERRQQHGGRIRRSEIETPERSSPYGGARHAQSRTNASPQVAPGLVEAVGIWIISPRERKQTHYDNM
jgi:hypothetical protein